MDNQKRYPLRSTTYVAALQEGMATFALLRETDDSLAVEIGIVENGVTRTFTLDGFWTFGDPLKVDLVADIEPHHAGVRVAVRDVAENGKGAEISSHFTYTDLLGLVSDWELIQEDGDDGDIVSEPVEYVLNWNNIPAEGLIGFKDLRFIIANLENLVLRVVPQSGEGVAIPLPSISTTGWCADENPFCSLGVERPATIGFEYDEVHDRVRITIWDRIGDVEEDMVLPQEIAVPFTAFGNLIKKKG